MFDGKSKTRYVGTGKQKDTSKAKLLSDARAQRERRALEKKRNTAALLIQTLWRRHAALAHSIQTVRDKLSSQLATITKITSLMPFNVPLDTLFTLMRCCVFVFSRHPFRTSIDQNVYTAVLSLVIKSSNHPNPSFCLFDIGNFSDVERRQRWQVLLCSYVTMVVSALNSNTYNAETAALVHHLAVFVQACDGFATDSSSGFSSDLPALRLGTARAISLSLCSVLRDILCEPEAKEIAVVKTDVKGEEKEEEGARVSLLPLAEDISNILRFALTNSGAAVATGILGTGNASYRNLWHVFTSELLGVPHVWRHPRLCPLLEAVLGLTAKSGDSVSIRGGMTEEGTLLDPPVTAKASRKGSESRAMGVWRKIFSTSAAKNISSIIPLNSCEERRPFAVLSHMLLEGERTSVSVNEGKESCDISGGSVDERVNSGTSFLLVNNFFDYALHRDTSLLSYSPHSTYLWVDMLSRALTSRDVPLVAAINKYHGLEKKEVSGQRRKGEEDDSADEEEGEEGSGDSTGNVGSRDVVNTILADVVGQTRARLLRCTGQDVAPPQAGAKKLPSSAEKQVQGSHGSSSQLEQEQESKRPRLLALIGRYSGGDRGAQRSSGAGVRQDPSVADTVELLTYLCHPIVLSAMAEHCTACLSSTQDYTESKKDSPSRVAGKIDVSPQDMDADVDALLQLLAVLLVHSPAGTAFAGQLTSHASIASQILNVFAFAQTSQRLMAGLWQRVLAYVQAHPGDYIPRFVLGNTSLSVGKVVPRSLFSPVVTNAAASSTAGGGLDAAVTNTEQASLLVLLCILSHQLLAIDDEEFMGGGKTLNISHVCELVGVLKALMCEMFWTAPLLTTHENTFGDEGNEDVALSTLDPSPAKQKELMFLRIHLLNLQLMYITTKVFNQLSVRNERIHFLPPSEWLWSSHTNAELEVLDVEANPFLDAKKTRARMVLLLCPQVIKFKQRAMYFQRLIQNDKNKLRNPNRHFSDYQNSMIRVNIHRAALFDSTFQALAHLSHGDWKKSIKVVFINEQGVEESGIDGGGLFIEFVDLLLKDMFSPPVLPPFPMGPGNTRSGSSNAGSGRSLEGSSDNVIDLTSSSDIQVGINGEEVKVDDKEYRDLFLTTATGLLVPNPTILHSHPSNSHGRTRTPRGTLEQYLFMGKMLGKAVYEEILVEPQFAGCFLNHLLGRINFIDDLVTLDQEIYHSLLKLKRDYLHGDADIAELQLTFEVDVLTPSGQIASRELMPGGAAVSVTKENLVSYLYLYANFKLNIETHRQSAAFLQGFRELIPIEWMRMFTTSELQLVIGGDNKKGIDVPALRRICTYSGGYHPSQPYIQAFWEIMESLTPADQGEFLRFVTSCSRPPLLGYGQFDPPFNIMKISPEGGGGVGSSRLPMAASCFNQLKLPQYATVEELREKLLYSIQSKSGFELT